MGKKFKSENNNISLHFLFIGTKYKKIYDPAQSESFSDCRSDFNQQNRKYV